MTVYYCLPEQNGMTVGIQEDQRIYKQENLAVSSLTKLVSRRDQKKLPQAAIMAGVLFEHFNMTDLIQSLGGDPHNTPLVICNRYANWDYVRELMAADAVRTAQNVDSYVATAWFPAAVQGYLTIRYGNVGQAITLATEESDVIAATVETFMPASGVTVLASFESVPAVIGSSAVEGNRPRPFGAISLIPHDHSAEQILTFVKTHQAMYRQSSGVSLAV
ncbi:MAG: hypothetical protein R3309_00550 [Reinekea sp.]|nr:hypothetical protein [Reinekea sp.]